MMPIEGEVGVFLRNGCMTHNLQAVDAKIISLVSRNDERHGMWSLGVQLSLVKPQ
jgi:hypothetical protein